MEAGFIGQISGFKILDDVNIFSSQKIEIMPSYSQIMDFLGILR